MCDDLSHLISRRQVFVVCVMWLAKPRVAGDLHDTCLSIRRFNAENSTLYGICPITYWAYIFRAGWFKIDTVHFRYIAVTFRQRIQVIPQIPRPWGPVIWCFSLVKHQREDFVNINSTCWKHALTFLLGSRLMISDLKSVTLRTCPACLYGYLCITKI